VLNIATTSQIEQALRTAFQAYQAGNLQEAEKGCRWILAFHPNHVDAQYLLAGIGIKLDRFSDAEELFRKVLAARPNSAEVLNSLGVALRHQDKFDDAAACFKKAIVLQPDCASAYNNLADIAEHQDRLDEAIALCRQALAIDPRLAESHNTLGIALYRKGCFDQALACYRQALALKPDFLQAHSNCASVLLLQGNFAEGWREYQWRVKGKHRRGAHLPGPEWNGESVAGRTILLYAQQGLGDTIQLARYIAPLAKTGARIIVECEKELNRFFQEMPGIHALIAEGAPLPLFDVHSPMCSLPLMFGTTLETIPRQIPYIQVDAENVRQWQSKLPTDPNILKVGLVWAGNPRHPNDRNRSISLPLLAPLFQVPNVRFFSLQKGDSSQMTPSRMMTDWTQDLHDLADTAALIAGLDLVISVDTSVAHLAGSMAKPVWLLLPYIPDWRWLLSREDSPWYPSMRLFRQAAAGDWKPVVSRVVECLANHGNIRSNSPSPSSIPLSEFPHG